MRKMVIGLITAFAFIAVGLILLMVFAIANGGFRTTFSSIDMKLVNTQNVSLEDIDQITVKYSSENVSFYQSDTDELVFKEYMNYTPDDDQLSRINKNGSELSIKTGRDHTDFSFWFFSHNCRVEIYLPSGYQGGLSVETSSGNIDSDPCFTFTKFTANCSSGNIKVNEIYADDISAETSSGNINFELAQGNRQFSATSGNIRVLGGAGDSKFTTSSGNITVENASGHIDAEASSGEVRITNSEGGGDLETSSGNITLELTSLTEDLKMNASSGNIKLTLPDSTSFDFHAKVSSGNINTDFDDQLSYNERGNDASGTIGDASQYEVNLEATSGNIRVNY